MKKNLFLNLKRINGRNRFHWLIIMILIFPATGIFAQNIVVKGSVKSTDGILLPGVNIMVKNTSIGTTTDLQGNYSIATPSDGALVFSFIGYETQEISINGSTVVDVQMNESTGLINEVVVVGYGAQSKSDLTGAVVSMKASDLEKSTVATTDQALQGRVAGVTVTTNSGSPGTPLQIRVRGVGTINDSDPLYVVDGFPMNDVGFLNPSDIASIEILKDASATAIYGSRGANGVIIITTKNGKIGQIPVITFDSYFGVSEMWKKPELLNASQWAQMRIEAERNGGTPIDSALLDYSSFGNGTDWVKEVTRKASTHNINLTVSGGSEKFTYFLSANNYLEEGIVKKTDFDRTTIRLNTSVKAKKWLNIGENLTLEYSKNHKINEADEWSAVLIQAVTSDPVTPVKRSNGFYSASEFVQMTNPVAHLEYTNTENITTRMIGNVFGEINFCKSLAFKSNMGINYSNDVVNDFLPTYQLYYADLSVNSSVSNYVSNIYRQSIENKAWNWSNYFTYTHQFSKHNVSLMAGVEASQDYSDPFDGRKTNLVGETTALRNFDNALDPNAVVTGSPTDKRISSYFGRLNYDYFDKYLFTMNIRRDGSTSFGSEMRYGTFPSFSAGWKINKENFMSNIQFISNLKIRAGWGQIGNDKIPQYGYYNRGFAGSKYVFNDQINNGVYFPGIENEKLHWETTTTTNLGLDLGLFKNKFTMSAEYYIKNTEDMLVDVPVPYHTGIQTTPFQNIGTMQNKGFELEINFKDVIGDFSYEIGGNFATFLNEVTSLGEQSQIQTAPLRNGGDVSMTQVGHPIAQFWGYKTNGLFQTTEDVQNWTDNSGNMLQPDAQPGDIRYAKNDTGGLYLGIIGNPLPKFTYGFNGQFNYKSFDLYFLFQGVYGNDVFDGTMVYTDRPDVATNLSSRMLDRWTEPYSTNDAHNPRLSTSNASNILFSDRYVEKGSYLRLKNIQLGYTIPQKLSQSLKIQKLRIYIGAINLLTFTRYKGFDPEIGTGYYGSLDLGIDRATYPQARTYLAGLNLTF